MHIELERTGTVQAFEKTLKSITNRPSVNGVLVLACDANCFMSDEVDIILKSCPVPLAGGIFPGLLCSQEKIEKGTIVIGLSTAPSIITVKGMSNPEVDFDKLLYQEFDNLEITDTILVFTDGFASRISALINAMFINLGIETNIIGGGSGSLSLEKKPAILSNEGMLMDVSLLILINTKSIINVSHGWTPVKGPFKVTESEGNVIKSLDWMPAFNIYREVIRDHSGQYISKENFERVSMSYPFGISMMFCDHIVRDPVKMTDDGSLVCVGGVEEGAFVDILHGNSESLIEASRTIATNHDILNLGEKSVALIVDCISRAIFMADSFEEELKAINLPDIPLIGMLSFGEIATQTQESLEFHNKTTVLSVLEEL
ncbi:FIST signal transduction protein [Maridesulfovibrio zosterae]|uniref:FIST signal transduction protein n=1 Tax=Maridesulfovibrio zosterae TaxID=82171 RepID=UPI000410D1F9|nr:FIST C-terminal domain-containing protein [Maridesulfovibrio zosterae]